jgi:hypothetical protein
VIKMKFLNNTSLKKIIAFKEHWEAKIIGRFLHHPVVVLRIKLGSFLYFSSNLTIHLLRQSAGTTR